MTLSEWKKKYSVSGDAEPASPAKANNTALDEWKARHTQGTRPQGLDPVPLENTRTLDLSMLRNTRETANRVKDIYNAKMIAAEHDAAEDVRGAAYRLLAQQIADEHDRNEITKPTTGERLGSAASSVGKTLVGSLGYLGETGAKAAQNVYANSRNDEIHALEQQSAALSNRLQAMRQGYGNPTWGSEGEIRDEIAELSRQIDALQLDDGVSPDSFSSRMLASAYEDAARATAGMTGWKKDFSDAGLSVAQNLAVLPTAAINPGVPLLLMGAQAAGSRAYELTQQGAGAEEALGRGLLSGVIEYMTEKLPLDNLIGIIGKGNIRNFALNILKQAGIEGTEEAVSYVLNYAADKLNKDPMAEFSVDELVQSAKLGAISGGFFGVGGTAVGAALNRTGQEAAPVHTPETQELLRGIGQIGRKGAEQAQRTLGENSRKNYEKAKEEDAGRTPDFDRQFDHYNKMGELGIEFDQIPEIASATPVSDAVKQGAYLTGKNDGVERATKLADRALAGETLTDAEIDSVLGHKETRQRFENAAGVKFSQSNVENRTTVRNYVEAEQKKPRLVKNDFSKEFGAETENVLDRLAKRGGAQIEIVESIDDGSIAKYQDGKIQISAEKLREDRAGALRSAVMHEMTHHIETSGQYEELRNGIESYLKSKGVDVEYELEMLAEEYEANGVDLLEDDQIWREYVAKNAESLLADEESVRYLARENRGLFDKIRQFLHDLVLRFKGTQDEKAVRDLLKIYDNALDTVGAHPENRYRGEQHLIKRAQDGTSFVEVEEDVLEGADEKDIPRILSDIIQNKFHNLIEANGQQIGVNARTGKEWRRSKDAARLYSQDRTAYHDKIRSFNNADELLNASRDYIGEGLKHVRKDNFVEFARGTVDFRVQGRGYTADVVVGTTKDGRAYLYDVVNLGQKNIADTSLYRHQQNASNDRGDVSANNKAPAPLLAPAYNREDSQNGYAQNRVLTDASGNSISKDGWKNNGNNTQNSDQKSVGRSIEELRVQGQQMTPEERKAYVEASRARRAKLRELAEQYGEIPQGERPAREISFPKQTNDDTRVRRFARTAAEASVLSDEQADAIEQAVLDGVFDYEPIGDKDAVSRAESKILRDVEEAKRDWAAAVRSSKRITKDDITLGELLLKRAAEEGDTEEVIRLTAEIAAAGTQAGQVVQAMRLLKQMGGAGQLAGIKQMVNRYQKDLEARGKEANRKTSDGKIVDSKTADKENKDAVKTHTRKAKDHAVKEARARAEEINKENIPLEDWPKETGNLLAKRLANRVTPPKRKDKTVCQTILGDLTKFAAEHSLPKLKTAKDVRGAADVLREYFDHKDFYTKAYKQAQAQLREKYKDDPDMLDRLDGFLNSTIDYNGDPMHAQTVMVEAMLKHVNVNSSKTLVETAALLGKNRAAKNLADKLVADIGVSGANEIIVRDAVSRLVTEMYIEKNGGKQLGKIVKAAIKEVSVKMNVLAESSPAERDAALQKVAAEIVRKYGFTQEDADVAVAVVAEEFTAYLDEVAQKKLKQIFGERKIRANREFWDIFRQYGRLGAFNSQYAEKAAAKLFGDGSIRIDPGLADALMNAKTEEEIERAKGALLKDIASQIPSTWGDKWNAWRYLAMLCNTRTHIRNVLGNAFFEPIVGVKNVLGAVIEAGTDPVAKKVRGKGIERTKTLKPASRAVKSFSKADYAEMEEIVKNGGKYNDGQKIDDYRTIFTNKAIEWVRKKNGAALEKEDGIFLGRHYTRALASYITANDIDVAKLQDGSRESAKTLDKARAYAIREAQKATYRDASQTAELIAQTARHGKLPVRMVIEGVLPFKKTPINILKRGLEYSPAGLVKAIYKGVHGLKNGGYSANEFIDDLAAGLSGTALVALGYFMTSANLLIGGGDDEDESKWYKDMLGYQSYAIKLGDNTTYTIDWVAPGSMPLFVGVELFNLVNGGKLEAKDLLGAMELVTAPLNNMSMLSGLNDTLDNLAYGGDTDNALMNLFTDSVLSYLSQAVPTLGGQIARTMDGTRRTTYADPNNAMPDSWEKALQKAGNKIPYLSEKNPAYINLWGETEETENPLYHFVTNALSPGYVDTIKVDALDEELLRLYEATGENVFPDSAGKSIRVGGETIKLTVDEFQTYAATLGKTSHEILYELAESRQYRKADDADKVAAVDMAYQYARALAKTGVSDYELDGWIAKAHDAAAVDLSPDDYILYKLACMRVDADQNGSITQDEAKNAIDSMEGLTKKQRAYLWQSQNKQWSDKKNPYK